MPGFYGDPGIEKEDELQSLMPILHAVRNRDLQDFEARGNITNNLAIRQERMKALFDPLTGMGRTTNNEISHGITAPNTSMNTVVKEDMSPQDKANLQLKKNDQTLESRKIDQAGKLGAERLGIQQQQEQLNEQKNENIHNQRQRELERKASDSESKLKLAYDRLQQQGDNAQAHIAFNQATLEATNARHALELAQKDKEHQDALALRDAQINDLNSKINERDNPKDKVVETNMEVDANGVPIKKTERTSRSDSKAFDSNTTYRMTDSDGKDWMVSNKNMDAFMKAHPKASKSTNKSAPGAK